MIILNTRKHTHVVAYLMLKKNSIKMRNVVYQFFVSNCQKWKTAFLLNGRINFLQNLKLESIEA